MRKILAMLILGCAAVVHAQVIGLNPTPQAIYFWNTATNAWTPCPNSSTAEPFASTPQAFTQEGFNTALGQWTPSTSCPSGMSNGITSFQGRTTSAAVLLLSDVTPILQSATNCNISGNYVYAPVLNTCITFAPLVNPSGGQNNYAPGTNPSGGQHNYAPLNDPSFTGGVVSTFSDTPIFGFNTSAASGTQISGLSGDCPNLVAGINSACGLAVGVTGTLNNFGALYFRYTGSGSLSNYLQLSIASGTGVSPKNGFCADANGNAAVNNTMSNAICGDGTHTLLVNGTVAATSYNGAAITSSGTGTNYLTDLGTYTPITAAGVPVDVTGSRTFGTIYTNTNAFTLQASGFGVAVTGSATNNISCLVGPTSPPTMIVWSETNGATTAGGAAGFICPRIPATWFYEVNKTNDLSATPSSWIESPTI